METVQSKKPLREVPMLAGGFLNSVEAFGERHALAIGATVESYESLFRRAASLAATLTANSAGGGPPLTAIFAYRSVTAFSGVLAALLRGHGYVPLNRTFPVERTKGMLLRSGCRAMVVDAESEKQLPQLLADVETPMLVILPERNETGDLTANFPRHRFMSGRDLLPHTQWEPVEVSPDSIAYLLFTSGSTGVPKGVMVSHRNVRHYVDFITERFSITREDRFSQTFDMTFDLSVADMFVAWDRGACVCCLSEKTLLNPARFINEAGLTVWFSVPSTGVFMKRFGSLKPGAYPKLRVSLFCGEALPVEIARAWAEAAPNSIVENIYGPTELTIACTYYRWDAAKTPDEAEHGVVPIGVPFPKMTALIADENLNEVPAGESGELLMTGPQLSLGYFNDPAKTSAAFVKPPGRHAVYYRTGDRVRKPADGKPMVYLGRMDNQTKILGHRVELGEVESVVREESGVDGVVALGWPKTPGGAGGVEVFLETEGPLKPELKELVDRRLPVYMAPRKYRVLSKFPLNANGKYDRPALLKILEQPTT